MHIATAWVAAQWAACREALRKSTRLRSAPGPALWIVGNQKGWIDACYKPDDAAGGPRAAQGTRPCGSLPS
jgi:hypothetical protein